MIIKLLSVDDVSSTSVAFTASVSIGSDVVNATDEDNSLVPFNDDAK